MSRHIAALRWAHQVQDRFPDGQLYVNLRGYAPGEPVTAQETLRRFLTTLGVPANAIPSDTEAAAALYRSLLADRRILLRAYAADQTQREEPGEERAAALRRVLGWYLHTADAAQTWIEPAEDHLPLDPPDDDVVPLSFADYDQAVDWSEREHVNFLPTVRAAEKAGLDRHTWQLSAVLWNAQAPSALVTDWLVMGQIGLEAARRLGDRSGEAVLLACLGMGYARINRLTESLECHREALTLRREVSFSAVND